MNYETAISGHWGTCTGKPMQRGVTTLSPSGVTVDAEKVKPSVFAGWYREG